jgi:hypothetical protein
MKYMYNQRTPNGNDRVGRYLRVRNLCLEKYYLLLVQYPLLTLPKIVTLSVPF